MPEVVRVTASPCRVVVDPPHPGDAHRCCCTCCGISAPRRPGRRRCPLTRRVIPFSDCPLPVDAARGDPARPRQRRQADRAADRAHVPARVPEPRPRRARRPGDRLGRRRAPRVHHRLLRRHADLLPRRRHRRARRQRHGQRPRDGRRARRSSCRSRSSSRRACRSPTCSGVVDSARRAAERAGVRDRHRRHQGRRARQRRQDLHQHLRHRPGAAGRRSRRRATCGRATRSCSPGTIGDHGMAILSQREGLDVRRRRSRATPRRCTSWSAAVLAGFPGVHAMRDPTRGGRGRDAGRDRLAPAARHRGRRARDSGPRHRARRLRDPRARSAARRQRGQARRLRSAGGARARAGGAARASARARRQPHRPRHRRRIRAWSCCARRSAATASSICRSARRCRASAEEGRRIDDVPGNRRSDRVLSTMRVPISRWSTSPARSARSTSAFSTARASLAGDWILIHAGFAMEKIDAETRGANQMAVLRDYTRPRSRPGPRRRSLEELRRRRRTSSGARRAVGAGGLARAAREVPRHVAHRDRAALARRAEAGDDDAAVRRAARAAGQGRWRATTSPVRTAARGSTTSSRTRSSTCCSPARRSSTSRATRSFRWPTWCRRGRVDPHVEHG